MQNKSKNLHEAKKNKNDEFYTQLSDIENELKHYKEHFKDKVVLCNCDDPLASNFFKYFFLNFKHLKLKELICTCYKSQNFREISQEDSPQKAYAIRIYRDCNLSPNLEQIQKVLSLSLSCREKQSQKTLDNFEKNKHKLKNSLKILKSDADKTSLFGVYEDEGLGNAGDFRSKDCIELLKHSDIVVTNPPFSLFREYVALLMQHKKKFVIVAHQNAISYKEIFKYIKTNEIWLGYGFKGGAAHFINYHYEDYATANDHREGMIRVSGVIWLTNLNHKKRTELLETIHSYAKNPDKYPKYDNYDAINVNKTAEIPLDYDGVMGVPLTFLDKHNPQQFEIVALGIVGSCEFSCEKKMEILDKNGNRTGKFTINAKGTLYRKWDKRLDKKPPAFRNCETGELYQSIYARILIRPQSAKNKGK
ncbi:modification methylase [Helicobacter sp. MIT 11-5569]|uniref:adenine-specific methyltransferase EcoRI family protein n=1 Tax=Helicobacter sp. MIT 11-5569 TaxID=1548151 RepID=UPI00051FC419|nr:adenine-specific methyltransferase EcoRI family protein [Helicobacter sp. MIT 11-5569]TLD84415.1 modification methylase [Helicobacter sp. MIT 11-5569]